MGCGKSSVGRELSELLRCPFMDLDEVIESREGRTIPEIFANDGEEAFRRMELEALKMIINSTSDNLVLALGGGTVMTPECARLVHDHTRCIYLRATVDTLLSRLRPETSGRPLLHTPSASSGSTAPVGPNDPATPSTAALRQRITGLMALRAATYEATAHLTLQTDTLSIPEIARLCLPVCK